MYMAYSVSIVTLKTRAGKEKMKDFYYLVVKFTSWL